MEQLVAVIKEFIAKADQKVINDIVQKIGIILIIAFVIVIVLVIRKLIKSIDKGEKYNNLHLRHKDLQSQYEELRKMYEKSTTTATLISQYLYDISVLIYKAYNSKSINNELNRMIEAIIYGIPAIIKSIGGENHRVFLWKPDNKNQTLQSIYSSTNNLHKESLPINGSFAGSVYITGKERYSEKVEKEKDYLVHPNSKVKYKSLIGIPIKWEDITIAVLTIDAKRENAFSDEDIESLCSLGILISICLLLKENKNVKIKL